MFALFIILRRKENGRNKKKRVTYEYEILYEEQM